MTPAPLLLFLFLLLLLAARFQACSRLAWCAQPASQGCPRVLPIRRAWTWGNGQYWQLGHGTPHNQMLPMQVCAALCTRGPADRVPRHLQRAAGPALRGRAPSASAAAAAARAAQAAPPLPCCRATNRCRA